jgi:hypothetical protein
MAIEENPDQARKVAFEEAEETWRRRMSVPTRRDSALERFPGPGGGGLGCPRPLCPGAGAGVANLSRGALAHTTLLERVMQADLLHFAGSTDQVNGEGPAA